MIQTLVHMAKGRIKPEFRLVRGVLQVGIFVGFMIQGAGAQPVTSDFESTAARNIREAKRTLYGEVIAGGVLVETPPVPVLADATICAVNGEIPQPGLGMEGSVVPNALATISEVGAEPDLTEQTTMSIRLRDCAFQYDVHLVRPRQMITFENADSIIYPVSFAKETSVIDTFDILPGPIPARLRAPREPGVYRIQGLRHGWIYCYLIVTESGTQTLRTDGAGRFRADVSARARGTVEVFWTTKQIVSRYDSSHQVRYIIPPLQRTEVPFNELVRDDLQIVLSRDRLQTAGKVLE